MKKLARVLLLCLMMLTIPIQGIAASTMQCCCAERHQSVSADEGSNAKIEKQAADEVDHAKHLDNSSGTEKCSSCANCCSGCGSATSSCATTVTSPTSEKIISQFSSHDGQISDGLERPPKN